MDGREQMNQIILNKHDKYEKSKTNNRNSVERIEQKLHGDKCNTNIIIMTFWLIFSNNLNGRKNIAVAANILQAALNFHFY